VFLGLLDLASVFRGRPGVRDDSGVKMVSVYSSGNV